MNLREMSTWDTVVAGAAADLAECARVIAAEYSRQGAALADRHEKEGRILVAILEAIAPAAAAMCGPPGILELVTAASGDALCLTQVGELIIVHPSGAVLHVRTRNGVMREPVALVDQVCRAYGLGSILDAVLRALRSQEGRAAGADRAARAADRIAAVLTLIGAAGAPSKGDRP